MANQCHYLLLKNWNPEHPQKLVEASYITITQKQPLLSNRKKRSAEFTQEVWKLHPLERIELHILQIILHHHKQSSKAPETKSIKIQEKSVTKRQKRLAKKK